MNSAVEELTQRVLKKFPGIPFQYARAEAEELWRMPATQISYFWLISPERYSRPLNGFASEFFCQNVLRRLGIGTAYETFICDARQANSLPADSFVVKCATGPGNTLNWNPGVIPNGPCLVSKLISGAATFSFVARKILRSQPDKNDPADKFYGGFRPRLWEVDRIRKAMSLDGIDYLTVCAARVFLGCRCTPHSSNLLVSTEGKLFSIDHTSAWFQTSESLRTFFGFMERSSTAFTVLGQIAILTEDDILASVDEIPKHPACGSTAELREYFCRRLLLWKDLYFSAAATLTHQ